MGAQSPHWKFEWLIDTKKPRNVASDFNSLLGNLNILLLWRFQLYVENIISNY